MLLSCLCISGFFIYTATADIYKKLQLWYTNWQLFNNNQYPPSIVKSRAATQSSWPDNICCLVTVLSVSVYRCTLQSSRAQASSQVLVLASRRDRQMLGPNDTTWTHTTPFHTIQHTIVKNVYPLQWASTMWSFSTT